MNRKTNDENGFEITKRTFLHGTAAAGTLPFVGAAGAADGGPAEVIVRAEAVDVPLVAASSTVEELKATAAESQKPIVEYVQKTEGLAVKNQFWLANALLLEVDTSVGDLEALAAAEGVETLHPNVAFELPEPSAGEAAADPTETTYGLDQIDVPEVWETLGTRGDGASVAVLDTGVDPDHPDVDVDPGNFAEFDDDGEQVDSEPHDSQYHGTHVSATVAGGDASGTAVGVAPDATLLHGLVIADGSGTFAGIIAGMEWAIENDADAINMSLGATGYFGELIEPVRNAERAGTVAVSSSGNSGAGTSGSPANVYDSVAVGATDESEAVADFSSGETIVTEDAWGHLAPGEWPDSYVVPDVSGPGVDVLSAVPEDSDPPFPVIDGKWAELSGTSMASPHVAGVVALMAAAAGGDLDPGRAKTALATTTWKPDGEPAEPDTRYGKGIVDALHATSRFGADGGVTGTVTDADGQPIPGATVELDGFPVETDADGAYTLRALAGTYEVTADAFGYASQTVIVDVGDGFVTRDFALGDELAATVAADQPEGVEAGEAFDVELRVAHADSLTVTTAGDYEGDATLLVDGEEARFGDAVAFDPAKSGTVTVTVGTDERGFGTLELEHVLAGTGETVTVTTGPTAVYERPVPVAVVDDGAFGADVRAMLERELHPRYTVEVLDPETALSGARNRDHEGYVVQNLGDEELAAEFAAVASAPEVGVVYLDQFGDASDAVSQVSAATGDPRDTFDALTQMSAPPVDYAVDHDHPVFDGIAETGDEVELYDPAPVYAGPGLFFGGFHTYYEDFRGEVAGATLADVAVRYGTSGAGLGVDDLSRTVLASSLGVGTLVGRSDFTADGRAVLANAVAHAARTPAIEVVEVPPEQVTPGETASLVVEGEDLLELEIDVTGLRFLDESDLALAVDGDPVAFGETVAFDEPRDGQVEITVETEADDIGEFALDTRFVTLGRRDREVETAVTFRPTTVYQSPISVPDQIEDLQTAVDFVRPGDGVVLAGGTYEVDAERGTQTGLYVGTPGITIRGAEGERPEIVHARDLPAPNVINVDADGVTVEGLAANVRDGAIDPKNVVGFGIRINEHVSGTTVRDVLAAGTSGVFLDQDVSDVRVEDTRAVDSAIGVGTDIWGGPVDDVTVTGLTFEDPYFFGWGGVYLENASHVTVTDCDITYASGYDAGVLVFGAFSGSTGNRIANNRIVGPDDDDPFPDTDNGVYVDGADAVIEDNEIVDTYVGVRVAEFGFGFDPAEVHVQNNAIQNAETGLLQFGDLAAFEGNDVAATTGVNFDGGYFGLDADAGVARYNDLSATDVPFAGEPADGWGSPEGPFDARLNYLGERGYDDVIVDGEVAYDPFLTTPPADVDRSATTAIGTDLYLDPGETYGLGVPGPSDRTIYDVLGVDGYREFAGDLEFWNHDSEKFQRVTGEGRLTHLDTLDAFRVTPREGVRAVVDFQRADDPPVGADGTPPGQRDSEPGRTHLQEGWNFAAAPRYGDGAFDLDAVDHVEDALQSPGRQLGDGETRAFTGYRVHATEDARLETDLDAYDPTMAELYESLGLDPVIHEDAGPGASVTARDVTVADVVDAAPDEERAAEAVTALVVNRIGRSVDLSADPETVLEDVNATAETAATEAPSNDDELVEDAVERAVAQVLAVRFGAQTLGEDGDFDALAAERQDGAGAAD
ncbi:hypothetical protein BRC81_07845 [Halobacteriales archaeon QS_1_68_20]|nr:MAG: hypothetical protein BRC81_07845 [Halobacteriales archaeon QS_1_68_20]